MRPPVPHSRPASTRQKVASLRPGDRVPPGRGEEGHDEDSSVTTDMKNRSCDEMERVAEAGRRRGYPMGTETALRPAQERGGGVMGKSRCTRGSVARPPRLPVVIYRQGGLAEPPAARGLVRPVSP